MGGTDVLRRSVLGGIELVGILGGQMDLRMRWGPVLGGFRHEVENELRMKNEYFFRFSHYVVTDSPPRIAGAQSYWPAT